MRELGIEARRRVGRVCAFGDNEPDTTLGAFLVVMSDVGTGNTTRRERTRHRRHHNPVGEFQLLDGEWREHGVTACRH
jgi:hypothetical protein